MFATSSDNAPHLGIAEVEREVGILKDALRVWERRYGFPAPARDGRGDRLYDLAQVRRLQLIKRLLDAGHRPRRVVPLDEDALQALLHQAQAKTPVPAPARPIEGPATETGENPPQKPLSDWLALLQTGQAEPLRAALRQHLLRHGLAHTITGLISPLSQAVGLAWEQQSLTVFHEHLFSETVQGVLRETLTHLDTTAGEAPRSPKVLLTTLPRELHGLGLLAVECFFALEGCQRVSLGPNTPLLDILKARRDTQADIVALSVSAHAPAREVSDGLHWLASQLPQHVALWVGGGNAALRSKRLPDRVRVFASAQEIGLQVGLWRANSAPGR